MPRRPPCTTLFPYTTLFRSELDPASSHDLAFPFTMVKRGRRAVFAPDARASERPVPSIEGEFRSEEHTSELQSRGHLVCRLLLEKKNNHRRRRLTPRTRTTE